MCQIQLIYQRDKLKKKDVCNFMNLMCFGGVKNKDAWGVFNKDHLFKQSGVFNPNNFDVKNYIQDNFIVGHNRLKCGCLDGFNFGRGIIKEKHENNHPFELDDFILVHNGVINNASKLFKKHKLNTKITTDSYIILYLINKYFKMSLKLLRKDKIIDSINKTLQELSGWYSIVLYDKVDDEIYYFKDYITQFHFCIVDKNILIGSTKKLNLNYTYLDKHKEYFIPLNNKIYNIKYSPIDKTFFRAIGNFQVKPKVFIKQYFQKERKGEIHNIIMKLPNSSNYEINESFEVILKNSQQLNKYLKLKDIYNE